MQKGLELTQGHSAISDRAGICSQALDIWPAESRKGPSGCFSAEGRSPGCEEPGQLPSGGEKSREKGSMQQVLQGRFYFLEFRVSRRGA